MPPLFQEKRPQYIGVELRQGVGTCDASVAEKKKTPACVVHDRGAARGGLPQAESGGRALSAETRNSVPQQAANWVQCQAAAKARAELPVPHEAAMPEMTRGGVTNPRRDLPPLPHIRLAAAT